MARSKTLHMVNHRIQIDQTDDPTDVTVSQVDLALELSKTLGRNIRQGNSFRIVGLQASLDHSSATDADTGIAAAVKVQYCPTNRHGVKAWQQMFTKWTKQKQLSGKIGQFVKFDDFEVCWSPGYNTGRTSTLYAGGMGDTTPEYVALYGSAASGSRTTLEDMYNSYQPVDLAGTDEFGVSIKSPKYTAHFPQASSINLHAHMSAAADWTQYIEGSVGVLSSSDANAASVHYMSGSAGGDLVTFGDENHLNAMTGVLLVSSVLLPHDVDSGPDPPTAETGWYLNLNIMVEGWSPLAKKAPRRKPRRTMKKKPARRTYKPRRTYRTRR